MHAFLALALLGVGRLGAAPDAFVLKPEWKGPVRASDTVDVDLGNSPEAFVQAAYSQIHGALPPTALVQAWAQRLRTDPRLRRVDVVRSLAQAAGKTVKLAYSDPWANDPELPPAGPKHGKRDIGAVMMFFFHCPGGVNCGMDWAANHVQGMQAPSPSLAWDGKPGFYDASNPGFWRHELRDAKAAGLDFVLANVYGPDMDQEGQVKTLAQALAGEADPVKVALLDDTWPWGERWFGPAWQLKPDLRDPTRAAARLYEAKWKPFFSQVPRRDWYLVDGRPLIYFYNAGKLLPLDQSASTLERMQARFKRDFGVKPYLVVDQAYFADPDMARVADGRFIWDPLTWGDSADHISWSSMHGKVLAHAMVRWDSVGRDKPGQSPGPQDRILQGPEMLKQVLDATRGADILVLATWNDLGEGTGLNRAYDYYYLGRWLAPDTFIQMIRQARGD